MKGEPNGWQDTPRVRLEVRETREGVRSGAPRKISLMARTRYKTFYLNGPESALIPEPAKDIPNGRVVDNSTQGGSASFGITFDEDTELTGYMKVKLWVSC